MARWRKGEQQVAGLIEQRHLQQAAADSQTKVTLEVPRQFLPLGFTVIFRLRFECGIPV